ncbi:beta-ketoacyl-ACP synthase III [Gloeocapsa sp. PCC 73106]|uniref:beta-ketoacyl-ACP synthase III n=1 Tax=Gloeocapsa sp. PCC 73106 TaxID=102232 RepID=UPI0002AC0293|nr:beta-ketoacyl-ACP synthase III [Gloeocapsa sp. PCC 73106]ELR96965.1 3-oxoacyl-(acyl-carrier-protein) synthase III [Gloeocapsa sp. PCC 73106]
MTQSGVGIKIIGCGSATPSQVLTNEQLSQIVDTSDEWIKTRTGISRRHLALADESLSELAAKAAASALEMAQLNPQAIDLIILATSTADDLFGSANKIQHLIGANQAVAFDLTAACSGFVFGLSVAASFIRSGTYQNILLIGADLLSRWVDWSDRTSCVLFGDGAGAVVCQANQTEDHLLACELYSDGRQNGSLNLAYQSESQPMVDNLQVARGGYQPLTMNGKEIYRFAVAKVPEVIEKALFKANLQAPQVDWLILHQANQRILDAVAERLQISPEKVISNLAEYGNTSAASIPLALDETIRQGKIKCGDIIVLSGFGAGLTWGAAIFRWGI